MTDGRGLRFEVVIPTRNRPEKLRRCLVALGASQGDRLPVLVCDSSDDERHDAVRSVCSDFPSARLVRHSGQNVAAARNACARHAHGDVLINVDDDICVDSDAVTRLIDCYAKTARLCVMAGAVSWGGHYSRPIVMRHIGYGRSARDGEAPDFLIGAFFIYSHALALALPWNERIRTSDDRFMGALWRRHGVALEYCPHARATHDVEEVAYDVDEQASHIYANLFDAVIANPSPTRALSYEILGFLAGARLYCRSIQGARRFCAAWLEGHKQLFRDYGVLRSEVRRRIFTEVSHKA